MKRPWRGTNRQWSCLPSGTGEERVPHEQSLGKVWVALIFFWVAGLFSCATLPRKAECPSPILGGRWDLPATPAPTWVTDALRDPAHVVMRVRIGPTMNPSDAPRWARCALVVRLTRALGAMARASVVVSQSMDAGGGQETVTTLFRQLPARGPATTDPENPVCDHVLDEDEHWVAKQMSQVDHWIDIDGKLGAPFHTYAVGRFPRGLLSEFAQRRGLPRVSTAPLEGGAIALSNRATPAAWPRIEPFRAPEAWIDGLANPPSGYRFKVAWVGETGTPQDGERFAVEDACLALAHDVETTVRDESHTREAGESAQFRARTLVEGLSAYVGCQALAVYRDCAGRYDARGRRGTFALVFVAD